MIGLGGSWSSSDGPLPRELDPLFRCQFLKLPIRIGRLERVAGFWETAGDRIRQVHGRRLLTRAPRVPGEPQSTDGEDG